jgi:hypothetical protein
VRKHRYLVFLSLAYFPYHDVPHFPACDIISFCFVTE